MSSTMRPLNCDDWAEAEQSATEILAEIVCTQTHQRTPTIPLPSPEPLAFGYSEAFLYWEREATKLGAVWWLDDLGYFTVTY